MRMQCVLQALCESMGNSVVLDSVITISIVKGSHAVMFRLVHYHIWSYFILRRGSNEYI